MPKWKPFIIPPKVIDTPALLSSLRLPSELLLMIFDHANRLDKICLALSCRHLLQVSALASLKVPPKCKHQGCYKEKLLKRVRPRDKRGNPKKSWGLCVDCMQYRPTKKSYWTTKLVDFGSSEVWNGKYSMQCPQCWREERQHNPGAVVLTAKPRA
ncbi:hypothetical protein CC80DRAFT_593512 [Byssothecium circinans]|uniref:F-box domain-containing protein n=1 Tax=Byssothecium circinans TaxID=147558 RepID=A0A6A5TXM0_9PLEO|nr:hypothetical protein CC80DRAFT_593512 [Byssothecium circinans]